jgi:hypothetical protein
MRGRFWTKGLLPGEDDIRWVNWKWLCKHKRQDLITGYEIPVIEVDGLLGDIVHVFVRINSTGKALTPQEKRHAKYYNSQFLREASRWARWYEWDFVDSAPPFRQSIAFPTPECAYGLISSKLKLGHRPRVRCQSFFRPTRRNYPRLSGIVCYSARY